jgi:hypothetical protein
MTCWAHLSDADCDPTHDPREAPPGHLPSGLADLALNQDCDRSRTPGSARHASASFANQRG